MKHNRLLNQFNYYKCIYKKIALFIFAFISIIDIYAKESDRLITHTVNQADNIEQVAKKITLKGKIIDANTQEAIIGANIQAKGSNAGQISDIDGNFILNDIDANSTLIVSYIGYLHQEIPIKGKNSLIIQLKEDTQTLNDVVVVGFAKQKKANMTGAVSSVKMDDIIGVRPIATTGSLLQGVAPGLQVTQDTGEPGGGSSFNIRGTTSINGGSPLILVDNVYYNGPLNMLNPNDIESVTVLKDASSASIYGARSAFGVILITTKGAQKSQKVQLTYNNNFTFSRPSSLPEKASPLQTVQAYKDMGYITYYSGQTVDTWLDLLHDYQANPKAYSNGYTEVDGMRYQLAESDVLGDFMSETGFQQKHDLTASGGSDDISYRMSLGYVSNDGIMVTDRDNYKRYNGRAFISGKITDWLTAQVDFTFSKQDKNMPSGANYQKAVQQASYAPTGMININGEDMISGVAANLVKAGGDNKTGYTDSRIFAKLIATPLKGLTLNAEFTYDHLNYNVTNFTKRVVYANADKFSEDSTGDNSTYYRNKEMTNYTALNIYGTYNKVFSEKHNFTVMLGYNLENSYKEGLSVTASEMINDELPSISQSVGEKKPDDSFNEFSILGFFGRLNYTYKERYLLELSGRADASSKFPRGSRWGFFPSASVGWRIMEEPFMESLREYIPEFKIRASYGEVGNQNISAYAFIPSMGSYRSSWLHDNQQPITLYSPDIVSNSFTWERVQSFNIGFDLSLLNNRLSANFDYFCRYTKDMLTDGVELPNVLGTGAPLQNVANLKSKGFELEMNWRDRIGDIAYSIGFNLYDYKSFITKFDNEAGLISSHYKGERLGSIWGYVTDRYYTVDDFIEGSLDADLKNGKLKEGIPHVEGIKPNPGDILYKDLDGNGIINAGKSTLDDPGDRTIIGNNQLRLQYGVNGSINWKGIGFSFMLQGVGKTDKYLSHDLAFPYYYEFGTIYKHQLDYWTPQNTNCEFPRLYQTGTRNSNYSANIRTQTKYLTNGAYMRVKNLTLAYTFSNELIKHFGISNLRIYATGENLFTFDHLPKGLDSSLSNKGGGMGYPFMKSYSFGLSITL